VLDELKKDGIETELIQLVGETLSGCKACYRCAENKDQKCAAANDRINEYIARMQQAEGILLGSPTYISDMTANMKAEGIQPMRTVGQNMAWLLKKICD